MTLEEKYKDKTVNEINAAIENVAKALGGATNPQERDALEKEYNYLQTFERTGAGNWKAVKKQDSAQGVIDKYKKQGINSAEEVIENTPNSHTQGTQSKGNLGDNKVAVKEKWYDPEYQNAKDTAEVTKEQEERAGNFFHIGDKQEPKTLTKESAWNDYNKKEGTAKGLFENFNALGMTAEDARKDFLSKVSNPSDAAKKAFKETYGVDLVVTDTDTKKETETQTSNDNSSKENKNKKYKSSMYGIIDAMKNGDIDPSTGIYFMLDALSKAARNTGIDIGNIGAQFSGGTVRDDYQDSLWNQRRSKMFANEMTSELNTTKGTDKEMEYNLAKEDLIGKGLSNEQADLALNASRTFNDKAEEFRKAGNDTMADLYALVGSAATKEVGPEEIAAIAASNVLNTPEGKQAADEIINALTGLVGTVGNTFGGINSILSFLTGKNK